MVSGFVFPRSARRSAPRRRRAFLGERSRCAVSRRPASSVAGSKATSRAPRRRTITVSCWSTTSSRTLARFSRRLVYVVSLGIAHYQFVLYSIPVRVRRGVCGRTIVLSQGRLAVLFGVDLWPCFTGVKCGGWDRSTRSGPHSRSDRDRRRRAVRRLAVANPVGHSSSTLRRSDH